MGFLDERIKQDIQNEMASDEQKIRDVHQRLIDAFCSDDNLDLLVSLASEAVRNAYKRGNMPISSVKLDMSIKDDIYSGTVAESTFCKDALLAAMKRQEPSTDDVTLEWNTREIDYSSYITDKNIFVTFDPPLE